MQTKQAIKIYFKPFAEINTNPDKGLDFEEFFHGLRQESINLLKEKGFEKERLPDAPKDTAKDPDFFKSMFAQLLANFDKDKNQHIEENELKEFAPSITESGLVVQVTWVNVLRRDFEGKNWRFTISPYDNGWEKPAAKPRAGKRKQ